MAFVFSAQSYKTVRNTRTTDLGPVLSIGVHLIGGL